MAVAERAGAGGVRLRDLGTWAVPPLALLAAVVPQLRTATRPVIVAASAEQRRAAEASASAQPSAPRPAIAYEDGACRILFRFAETDRAIEPNQPRGGLSYNQLAAEKAAECDLDHPALSRDLRGYPMRILVATVPDPNYSQSASEFDNGVEAIQAAAADAGYSFDSSHLPWAPRRPDSVPAPEAGNPDREPGVILFKSKCSIAEPCDYRLLLIFLVGETPTGGIHRLALSSALHQTWQLASRFPQDTSAGCDSKGGCTKVSLMAPFYTGSAFSLVETLRQFDSWLPAHGATGHPLKLTIISGSAGAVDQIEFSSLLDAAAIRYDDPPFRATEGYNPEMRDGFVSGYLSSALKADPGEIAILRESGTGYGQNSQQTGTLGGFVIFLRHLRDYPEDPKIGAAARALLKDVLRSTNELRKKLAAKDFYDLLRGKLSLLQVSDPAHLREAYDRSLRYVDMPFPIHISQLRTAQPPPAAPPPILGLYPQSFFPVMTAGSETEDSIPAFSELNKASADRVMANLLGTLSQEDYHYVGIYATDAQDIIYLAQQVRRRCPDTLLFTFGTNLLFVNPDIAHDLRGMLVIGTYPLITINQHWTYPADGYDIHHQFASESTEGIYNAMLALLDRPERMLEYEVPFASPSEGFPWSWVMAVGNRGLQPIALLPKTPGWSDQYAYQNPGAKDAASEPAEFSVPTDLASRSWIATLLFWASTIFCLWFAWFAMWPRIMKERGAVWRSGFRESATSRTLALAAFLMSLLLAYLLVAALVIVTAATTCDDCRPPLRLAHQNLDSVFLSAALITLLFMLLSPAVQFVKILWSVVKGAVSAVRGRKITGRISLPETLSVLGTIVVPAVGIWLAWTYLNWFASMGMKTPVENARVMFASLRYETPGNGISPFPPLFFCALTIVFWSASCVRRLGMLEAMADASAQADDDGPSAVYLGFSCDSLRDLAKFENIIRSFLSRSALRLPFRTPLMVFLAATFVYAFGHVSSSLGIVKSIEGPEFDRLFFFLFVGAYTAIVFNFLRLVDVWTEFYRLLRRISWSPLQEACARVGDLRMQPAQGQSREGQAHGPALVPPLSMSLRTPTITALQFSVEQAERLLAGTETILREPADDAAGLAARVAAAADRLREAFHRARSQLAMAFDAHADGASVLKRNAIRMSERALSEVTSMVAQILDPDWWLLDAIDREKRQAERGWVLQAQIYLGSRVLDYSRHLLAQLSNLLSFSILGFVTMLLAASSYPFIKSDTMLRISWMMLLVVVALGVWVFLQIKRDRILSLLAGETPGRIDWNAAVIGHLTLYALIPLLAILGVQFPATLEGIVNSVISLLSGTHP